MVTTFFKLEKSMLAEWVVNRWRKSYVKLDSTSNWLLHDWSAETCSWQMVLPQKRYSCQPKTVKNTFYGDTCNSIYFKIIFNFQLAPTPPPSTPPKNQTNKQKLRKHQSGIFLVSCFRRIETYQHLMLNL